MIYVIKEYNKDSDYHVLLGEDIRSINVDIMVSGDLEAEEGSYHQYCQDIVGKRVEIEDLTAYISIGHGVKLL